MRTYSCGQCGCLEQLNSLIPDCCSLCGGSLSQIGGPPEPEQWFPPDDAYDGLDCVEEQGVCSTPLS